MSTCAEVEWDWRGEFEQLSPRAKELVATHPAWREMVAEHQPPSVDEQPATRRMTDYPQWIVTLPPEAERRALMAEDASMDWDRTAKVPYSPAHPPDARGRFRKSKADVPALWTDYTTARDFKRRHGFGALGFVFAESDPFVFVDFDAPKPRKGEHPALAGPRMMGEQGRMVRWVKRFAAATCVEFSTSGKGYHAYCVATKPEGKCRRGNYEMYDRAHYALVTNNRVNDLPCLPCQDLVDALHAAELTAPPPCVGGLPGNGNGRREPPGDDQELLRLMFASKNGAELRVLHDGGGYDDLSRGDLAWCSQLAWWTGGDAERVERMWLGSPRGERAKVVSRSDYRARTIAVALGTA